MIADAAVEGKARGHELVTPASRRKPSVGPIRPGSLALARRRRPCGPAGRPGWIRASTCHRRSARPPHDPGSRVRRRPVRPRWRARRHGAVVGWGAPGLRRGPRAGLGPRRPARGHGCELQPVGRDHARAAGPHQPQGGRDPGRHRGRCPGPVPGRPAGGDRLVVAPRDPPGRRARPGSRGRARSGGALGRGRQRQAVAGRLPPGGVPPGRPSAAVPCGRGLRERRAGRQAGG